MSAALALPAASLPGESGAPFVAIDFETADAGRDSACAVALVRVEGERIVRSEGRFLRPPRISSANTHVHGISEATQRSARPLREVWPELAPLLDGVGLLVAHNAPFDQSVLRASWAVAGLTPPGLPWASSEAGAQTRAELLAELLTGLEAAGQAQALREDVARKLADSMDVELQQLTKAIAAGKRSELLDHHWRYRASDNVLELVCELTGAVTERRFATDDEAALFSQGGLFDDNSGGGVH